MRRVCCWLWDWARRRIFKVGSNTEVSPDSSHPWRQPTTRSGSANEHKSGYHHFTQRHNTHVTTNQVSLVNKESSSKIKKINLGMCCCWFWLRSEGGRLGLAQRCWSDLQNKVWTKDFCSDEDPLMLKLGIRKQQKIASDSLRWNCLPRSSGLWLFIENMVGQPWKHTVLRLLDCWMCYCGQDILALIYSCEIMDS